jgi:betaine lipid synthase
MASLLDSLSRHLESVHFSRDVFKRLPIQTSTHPLLPIYLLLLLFSVVVLQTRKQIYLLLRFAYSCFLAPIGHSTVQKDRLDAFYKSQASIYDATRGRLLKGREEMLRLAASHVQNQLQQAPHKRGDLVWVDVGGGTGWNIEHMAQHMDLSNFRAIFLIDLCE